MFIKKLCQTFIRLLPLFSVSLFLLFGLVFGSTANASINDYPLLNFSVYWWGEGSNYGTVQNLQNQILICSVNDLNEPVASVKWNNINLINLNLPLDIGGRNPSIWYLINPSIGTYSLNFPSSTAPSASCVIYTDVNQDNPFSFISSLQTNNINTYTSSQSVGSKVAVLYSQIHSVNNQNFPIDSFINFTHLNESLANTVTYPDNGRFVGQQIGITNANKQISNNFDNISSYYYLEFNSATTPPLSPPQGSYVYITNFHKTDLGNSEPVIYSTLGTYKDFSYIFNFCNNYNIDNEYVMVYGVGGVEVSRQQISSESCSSEYFASSLYHSISMATSTGSSTLAIMSMPYQLNKDIMDEPLDNLSLVAFSQEFQSVSYQSSAGFIWLRPTYSINSIDTVATSTKINFSYNFSHNDSVASTSKVCIDELGSCYNLSNLSGEAYILIDNDNVMGSLDVHLTAQDIDSKILYTSDPFNIYRAGVVPKTVLENYLGKSAYDLACNESDWANNSNNLFIGWCDVRYFFWSMTGTGVEGVSSLANGTIGILKNVFPFSLPIKISESWNNSANAVLPAELSLLNQADKDGNILIQMPANLFGATSTRVLVGKGMLPTADNPSSILSKVLALFKALSVYVNWGALAIGIFLMGGAVIDLLNGGKDSIE